MKKWEGTASLNAERYSTLGSVTLTFDLWVKCCDWWRKIICLRIFWWPLRVNRTVNEEMRGYRPSKMTFLAVFGSVTLTFDLWVKCCEWWRKILWLRIVWWPLRVNRTVNEEMRGYRVTQRWTLFDARLRDLDLWPLGQMLRLVTQDNMLAHLLVAFASKSDSKWRNERVPTVKNDVFSGFWLRDLDLWPLGQMLRMVTQDIVIAHRLVAFASKSDSKWRNERVPTVKNDVFSGFWLRDLDLWPQMGQMLRSFGGLCEWWRKILWLRIVWWPLRVNRTVNEEMRGYRPSKMTFLAVFGSVTLTFDLWVKCCEWWRKILWLRIVWWPLRVNRTVNEEMRGYRPSKMTFLAVFGSVTLTFDLWVKCCEWWRKILWLRIVWWPLRVNRTEEMRGYRVTQRTLNPWPWPLTFGSNVAIGDAR